MPELTPRANGPHPKDWRYAMDALIRFKRCVAPRGIDTSDWQIIVPTKVKGMFDPRWQLQYRSKPRNAAMTNVYIGSTGMDAAKAIDNVAKVYMQWLNSQTESVKKPVPATDARFSRAKVQEFKAAFDNWPKEHAGKYKGSGTDRFMRSRAGVLPMTMRQYLYSFWMSKHWLTPPQTDQELQRRIKEIEQRHKWEEEANQLRRAAHGDYDDAPKDNGPGWMG